MILQSARALFDRETHVTQYVIDAGVSRFTVRAFAAGMLSALGHNPTFAVRDLKGELEFDEQNPAASSMRLVVRASSLELQDNMSEKDRREILRTLNEDVLETARYPDIVYECRSVTVQRSDGPLDLLLDGELSLHGVTRRQAIPVRISVMGSLLRAFGEFTLRQTDYGIRLVAVAGRMLQVKDELKFSFELVARAAA